MYIANCSASRAQQRQEWPCPKGRAGAGGDVRQSTAGYETDSTQRCTFRADERDDHSSTPYALPWQELGIMPEKARQTDAISPSASGVPSSCLLDLLNYPRRSRLAPAHAPTVSAGGPKATLSSDRSLIVIRDSLLQSSTPLLREVILRASHRGDAVLLVCLRREPKEYQLLSGHAVGSAAQSNITILDLSLQDPYEAASQPQGQLICDRILQALESCLKNCA